MTATGLFDLAPVQKRRGCTDLVRIRSDVCHNCGVTLTVVEATQLALFYFGGYGEAKHGVVHACLACGWVGNTRQESVNPRWVA